MDWYASSQNELNPSGYGQWKPSQDDSNKPIDTQSFEDEMDEAYGEDAVKAVISKHGLELKLVRFTEADPVPIVYSNGNPIYVIDDFEFPRLTVPQEWIDGIDSLHLDEYVKTQNFNEDFWNGVGRGTEAYHGTSRERLPSIMKNGLEAKAETRGMSNKWDSPGVFTSSDYETAAYSYEIVLRIDVSAMKSDGYMPEVRGEDPLHDSNTREQIAFRIGLKDYYKDEYTSDGLREDTVVFLGTIPPKYLSVV